MDHRTLLDFMKVAEKLKCNTRHSWTSSGRQESVEEHTYRLCVFAWLVREGFPECDMGRVMKMCLFHDIGEAYTGDIPCFEKKTEDEETESGAVQRIAELLPKPHREELLGLWEELEENRTMEAGLVHALDKMEALIQHNEAPIESWLPLEYELQMTYGQKQAGVHPYLKHLRKVVKQDSVEKIEEAADRALDMQIQDAVPKEAPGYSVRKGVEAMDRARVVELLHSTYWAKDRDSQVILKGMENSIPYGIYRQDGYMVGYARILSDLSTMFYLMDVVVDEKYRGLGLGRMLMDAIMEDVGHLHGVLHTGDAQGLYRKYGFTEILDETDQIMEKPRRRFSHGQ